MISSGLVASPRLQPGDLEHWLSHVPGDAAWAQTDAFLDRVDEAVAVLVRWTRTRTGYVGISWGKDSMVVAHMAATFVPAWPLVWVRPQHNFNPDCLAVRDAFMGAHPHVRYQEIEVPLKPRAAGGWHMSGSLERGFGEARRRFGDCHVSGVRGDESAVRRRMVQATGGVNQRALAPLARWCGQDVFAFLNLYALPIHPAYAMSMGGTMDRDRLRVASLTGRRGTGWGRRQWEEVYYPEYSENF